MASATVCYSFSQAQLAKQGAASREVYVAPNALYSSELIQVTPGAARDCILYVGRLVQNKKVSLIIEAANILVHELHRDVHFLIVGEGAERSKLEGLTKNLDVTDAVSFLGWVSNSKELAGLYSRSVCSLSPGYAGLSLTQSLGFGVPVIVADDEFHSPEIELDQCGGVRYFRSDDSRSLAERIEAEIAYGFDITRATAYSDYVRSYYSASSMAEGLLRAFTGTSGMSGSNDG